jgi:hypothetical protein
MKKSPSPGPRLKPSGWGKLLLAASLLLVFVVGALQLYEVQEFLFPGKYHAIKLNLISREYFKIHQGMTSLQAQVDYLSRLQKQQGQPNLVPAGRSPAKDAEPSPADEARLTVEPSWPSLIHAAKKKRVYVARKLNYINVILKSMHLALEAQISDNRSGASTRKLEIEKTLQQIGEDQARWRIYNDRLNDLSQKLGKLVEWGQSPSTKTVSDIKNR